jgi:hypothetical protein
MNMASLDSHGPWSAGHRRGTLKHMARIVIYARRSKRPAPRKPAAARNAEREGR